jgi:hypothetical protein
MLICGITMAMAQWDFELLRELRDLFEVAIFDSPGIGESIEPSKAPLTIWGMPAEMGDALRWPEAIGVFNARTSLCLFPPVLNPICGRLNLVGGPGVRKANVVLAREWAEI